MTSFMALDGVTSFLRLKDVTITCKRMRRSLNIGGSSLVQWRKVGRSWRLRMCFRRLLCVRIEIDQLHCMNCWVIIHCLSVSCAKINHSRCALVIWSSLQLTSKQWIITQQFTAGADLFLKFIQYQWSKIDFSMNWCLLGPWRDAKKPPAFFNISLGTWQMLMHEKPCLITMFKYSKTCLKRPLKKKTKIVLLRPIIV